VDGDARAPQAQDGRGLSIAARDTAASDLGSSPAERSSNADVVAWVASMRAEGLSPSRVRQAYHLLSAVLASALRDRRIAINPASGVELPRLPSRARRYLTHEQLLALAHECSPYEVLVLLLGYCGLRWGEATALRNERIDLMRGRLAIVEAVTEVNGALVFGTPKTHQSRSVPVPRFLSDLLARHVAGRDLDELTFAAPRGGVLRSSGFRRRHFDPATSRLGFDGFVPHELRHTAASLAIASGASVKGVQHMLGHASATLTLDLYGHLFGDELDLVAERLDTAARQVASFSRTTRGLARDSLRPRQAS
jgi:integrase